MGCLETGRHTAQLTDVTKLHNLGWHHKIEIERRNTPFVRMVFERYLHQPPDQLNYIFHIPLVYYTHNLYICRSSRTYCIVPFKNTFPCDGRQRSVLCGNYTPFYMLKLKTISLLEHRSELDALPEGKLLINTINAHSYNTALKDPAFAEALLRGDALIPERSKHCTGIQTPETEKIERTAGWDLFLYEMNKLNRKEEPASFWEVAKTP